MKRLLLLLTALAVSGVVAGPLLAQDNPLLGTWKLNVAKSKFVGAAAPKSLTRTVVTDGTGAKYTFTGVAADGTAYEYSFNTNFDGRDGAVTGSGAPGGADAIAIKRIGTNKAVGTLKKGGKEIGTAETEVSKDGKISTVKTKTKDAKGKEVTGVSVYEKQ